MQLFDGSSSWIICDPFAHSIKMKVEKKGTPLKKWNVSFYRGILTGLNEAFIIDGTNKEKLIAEDPNSADIIRPILRGKDIKRYNADFHDNWILFIPWHFPLNNEKSITGPSDKAERLFKEKYPGVYNYLLPFKSKLEQRNVEEVGIRYEWYALQRYGSNYWEDFSKPKLMYNEITQRLSFIYVEEEMYCTNTAYFIADNEHLKYLLACLNSNLYDWYYKRMATTLGKATRMLAMHMINLPVIIPTEEKERQIVNIIDDILKKHDVDENVRKIDKIIYEMFNLTEEEIDYIESEYK